MGTLHRYSTFCIKGTKVEWGGGIDCCPTFKPSVEVVIELNREQAHTTTKSTLGGGRVKQAQLFLYYAILARTTIFS